MKKVTDIILLVVLGTLQSVNAHAESVDVRYATGKTKLISIECTQQAELALKSIGAVNVSTNVNLVDWKENNIVTKNSASSSSGTVGSSYFSIQCNPFSTDIVFFVSAGDRADLIKELWDSFYKRTP